MVSCKLHVFVYGNKQITSFAPLAHFDYNKALVIFEDLITNEHKCMHISATYFLI